MDFGRSGLNSVTKLDGQKLVTAEPTRSLCCLGTYWPKPTPPFLWISRGQDAAILLPCPAFVGLAKNGSHSTEGMIPAQEQRQKSDHLKASECCSGSRVAFTGAVMCAV